MTHERDLADVLRLAESVVDRRPEPSYVAASLDLANFMLRNCAALVDAAILQDKLDAAQRQCVSLLEELRASGICLPGWWCIYCRCFNGEAREKQSTCRACGRAKCAGTPPEGLT